MASAEIVSNLKLITSGNVPTTSNLGNGELAFGLVGGVAKLYGNVNGTIVDFSNFVEALACDIHKDFSAGENGKVCIGSIPVYDNNITIDISCTTANTYHGTLVIATQNYYIQSAVMYGDENNMLAPLVKIEHTKGIVTVYCAFPGYSKNQVHIKVTPKQGEVTRVLERVAEMPTTNLYNFTKALTFPVTSVNGKTGAVTLNKSDVGLGNVDNTADANKSVAQAAALKGTDTRDVNSPPSFYQREANSMKSVYEFKYTRTIKVESFLPDAYCYVQTLTPWGNSSGGLPVQLAAQGYGGTARYAIRSATDASTWGAWKKIATQDEIPSVPVLSVNTKTGNVVLVKGDVGLGNVDNVRQYSESNPPPYPVISVAGKTGAVTLLPSDIGDIFKELDGKKVALNSGTKPTYNGTSTGVTFSSGFGVSQGIQENSGIWFDSDQIVMWSPCDKGALNYYDEDNGALVFKIDANGILTRKDGKKALYEGEAGGGTPYVTTISSWSGSSGNYYKRITATTHGKGTYPSVHTYVQNESLWEETYDSPAIDSSGNVTVYTNVAISIKVVIK
jgi:hypothetical protein